MPTVSQEALRPVLHLGCQSCGARLVLEPALRTTRCPYCAAPAVVDRPPIPDVPSPAFVLGFTVTHEAARARVTEWLKSRGPFRRSGLRTAEPGEVRGVYVPAFLYSALATSRYHASVGENYQEAETYTATENGKQVTRTRTVTRTEWHPLEGELSEYVADVLVTASTGLRDEELEALKPFDLRRLARYSPALVSGWVAEEPSLTREASLARAHQELLSHREARLEGFLPGDSHQSLRQETDVSWEALDVCLLPVWVLAVRYAEDAPPLRVLVNGQTGEVYGKAPLSWVKVLVAVLVVLGVLGAAYLLLAGGAR
jgi:hypothetical protein